MKNLLQWFRDTPEDEWNYYEGIDGRARIKNPFYGIDNYSTFIRNFFDRGGKVRIFEMSNIDTDDLHRPNHICSVFFFGILLYYRTYLHKRYHRPKNDPGYRNFPFVWFLIALFHDNAYRLEKNKSLMDIHTIDELKERLSIDHDLFSLKPLKCPHLMSVRPNYFIYIKKERDAIDHGILGGILLYDRLVKIRKEKKANNEDNLLWGKKLENDYRLAATAISIHNIWLPKKEWESKYLKYGLNELIGCPKAKFIDFPLYYILSIVDTLEPLKEKAYQDAGFSDRYILENIEVEFKETGVVFCNKPGSKLDFDVLFKKAKGLQDWLEIKVVPYHNKFELFFS